MIAIMPQLVQARSHTHCCSKRQVKVCMDSRLQSALHKQTQDTLKSAKDGSRHAHGSSHAQGMNQVG